MLTWVMLIAAINMVYISISDIIEFEHMGLRTSLIPRFELGVFIYLVCYLSAFVLSVFLNKRGKYLINTIISGLLAVIYIGAVIIMFAAK